jgi:hypothetical protein
MYRIGRSIKIDTKQMSLKQKSLFGFHPFMGNLVAVK